MTYHFQCCKAFNWREIVREREKKSDRYVRDCFIYVHSEKIFHTPTRTVRTRSTSASARCEPTCICFWFFIQEYNARSSAGDLTTSGDEGSEIISTGSRSRRLSLLSTPESHLSSWFFVQEHNARSSAGELTTSDDEGPEIISTGSRSRTLSLLSTAESHLSSWFFFQEQLVNLVVFASHATAVTCRLLSANRFLGIILS